MPLLQSISKIVAMPRSCVTWLEVGEEANLQPRYLRMSRSDSALLMVAVTFALMHAPASLAFSLRRQKVLGKGVRRGRSRAAGLRRRSTGLRVVDRGRGMRHMLSVKVVVQASGTLRPSGVGGSTGQGGEAGGQSPAPWRSGRPRILIADTLAPTGTDPCMGLGRHVPRQFSIAIDGLSAPVPVGTFLKRLLRQRSREYGQ